MHLKNTINLLILFIPFFFLSCKKLDNLRNKEEKISFTENEEIENIEIFNNMLKNDNKNYLDYYSKSAKFLWKNEKILNKKFTIKDSSIKYQDSYSLNIFIINAGFFLGSTSILLKRNGKIE